MTDRNPQAEQMASDAMVRTLQAQADAIWPLEGPLFDRYDTPDTVLDVGCGTGVITARIADRFPAALVAGVDVHEPHLDRARVAFADRGNLHFRTDDAYDLDQPDGSVDLLVCRHVLQSLPEPHLVLDEMHRVLAPDGRVHAFVNRCSHRGALVQRENHGNATSHICLYHHWAYDLTGKLIGVPHRNGIGGSPGMPEDFDMACHGLRTLRVESIGGVLFASWLGVRR